MDYPYTSGASMQEESRRSVLIEQAMVVLGVSRRTVYYWIRDGRLRTIRTRCGSQRVLLESIRQMSDHSASSPAPSRPAGATSALVSLVGAQ